MINTSTKKWNLEDYLHYYEMEGNEDYKLLKDFCTEFDLNIYNGIGLLSGRTTQPNSELIKNFKKGVFKVKQKDINHGIKVIKMLDDYKDVAKEFYKSKNFLNALSRISKSTEFNHELMMKKVSLLRSRFFKCVDVKSYVQMLSDIYNYKNRNKITFEAAI